MSSSSSNYVAPEYDAPKVLTSVGNLLRAPRKAHSIYFSDILSPNNELQHSYVDGISSVCLFFVVFWLLWVLLLMILKCRGKESGCAAGRAFERRRPDDVLPDKSTSLESTEHNSSVRDEETGPSKRKKGQHRNTLNVSDGASDAAHNNDDDDSILRDSGGTIAKRQRIMKRERRTRIAFLLFGLLSMISALLTLVLSFSPIRDSMEQMGVVATDIGTTTGQIETSLDSIVSASIAASVIAENTPSDLSTICPDLYRESIGIDFGIDLSSLFGSFDVQYKAFNETVKKEVLLARETVDQVNSVVGSVADTVDRMEGKTWLIPGLLLSVGIFSAMAMLGVLLAWKEKSGRKVQRVMSWFVLPVLVILCTACWAAVIGTAIGSMVTSDLCTASMSNGTPDDTIQSILMNYGVDRNSTMFVMVNAYTNQCEGADPAADLKSLERDVQDTIDVIWTQLSKVDSIGRATVVEECGSDTLSDVFDGARDLAQLLRVTREALADTAAAIDCDQINPIYSRAVHEIVCEDAAGGTASGFILFLLLAISTMTMISLRASWLQLIEEDRVYHDEDEVAENMILDEHEEYLGYIANYKHEWQEYGGIEKRSRSSYDDREDDSYCSYYDDTREDSRSWSSGPDSDSESEEDSTADANPFVHPSSAFAAPSCSAARPQSMKAFDDTQLPPFDKLPPSRNPSYLTGPVDSGDTSTSERAEAQRSDGTTEKFVPGLSARSRARKKVEPGGASSFRGQLPTVDLSESSDPPNAKVDSRGLELDSFFSRHGIDPTAAERELGQYNEASPKLDPPSQEVSPDRYSVTAPPKSGGNDWQEPTAAPMSQTIEASPDSKAHSFSRPVSRKEFGFLSTKVNTDDRRRIPGGPSPSDCVEL